MGKTRSAKDAAAASDAQRSGAIRRVEPATIALCAVLSLAAFLRIYGITWGLPDSLHLFSFHPDETIMLTKSLPEFGGVNLGGGDFLPHFYDYGSLPFYLINLAVSFAKGYHLIGPIVGSQGIIRTSFSDAYLIARMLSVLMGIGTVWAVYAIGRRWWDAWTGLLAAALIAITPLHVQHSHFATVDVGAAFWQMLSLVWTAKLLTLGDAMRAPTAARPRFREALAAAALAGVFAGMTAATKYSGALVLLSVWIAVLARPWKRNEALGILAAASICAAVAFFITCPGSVFDTKLFIGGIQFESNHVMHHGEIYFQDTGSGWVYIIARNLDAGMGLPLLIVSMASVLYACVRRRAQDAALACFALPYYLLTGAAQSRYARYEIPLLPILALWSARFVMDMTSAHIIRWKAGRIVAAAAAVCVGMFTLFDAWWLIEPMAGVDPREAAAIWLNVHAPSPTKIAFGQFPWFWTPPINILFAAPQPESWLRNTSPQQLARYCFNPNEALDPAMISACDAPVTVLSEYDYYDALRLRQSHAIQYIDELKSGYNKPIVFADPRPIGAMRSIDGLPVQDLPTDMLYPRPTVLIYVRR